MNNLPPITVMKSDREKLLRYAKTRSHAMPEVANFLRRELLRARVLDTNEVPRNVVTMNSRFLFRMSESKIGRVGTLVHPSDAKRKSGRISVLSPVGVALLGLGPGQVMPWRDASGRDKALVLQCVLLQPKTQRGLQ